MFKKNKYLIIKKAISKDLASFVYTYFCMKREVCRTLFRNKFIPPFEKIHGAWTDPQMPDTYCLYGDSAFESILLKLKPLLEKHMKVKLIPNYAFGRLYKTGDILPRHKDRFSCQFSTTLNLGGDMWPIYLNPKEEEGHLIFDENGKGVNYVMSKSKGIAVKLEPGDMLLYRGDLLEHWREPFKGKECAQVFLHYTDKNVKGAHDNIFDTRPHLGLPPYFRKGHRIV
tara:strand:+ start:172 stop:852 length:681 start_codon:yes stop_codon:yes gene_type:complete